MPRRTFVCYDDEVKTPFVNIIFTNARQEEPMQKFSDYKYERPDLDAVRETVSALTDAMHNARTPDEAAAVIEGIFR